MRFKVNLLWILIFVSLSVGCGPDEIQDTLLSLSSSSASIEITGVPPELQDLLWGESDEVLRAAQEAHYTKYIDAGGVAILGNSLVDDELFLFARAIVLEMTSKHPEIRERLSPSAEQPRGHYQILVNGRYRRILTGTPNRRRT